MPGGWEGRDRNIENAEFAAQGRTDELEAVLLSPVLHSAVAADLEV